MSNLKNKSNVALVKHAMEIGGRTGAMKQIVIMHAIRSTCEAILQDEQELRENWNNGLVTVDGWIDAAREVIQIFEEGGR